MGYGVHAVTPPPLIPTEYPSGPTGLSSGSSGLLSKPAGPAASWAAALQSSPRARDPGPVDCTEPDSHTAPRANSLLLV
jgi:hypothetical protein